MSDLLQLAGAILILVPFTWQQLGSLSAERPAYLWPNLVGSGILAWIALDGEQWGFLLLEAVWSLVALRSLVLVRRRGPDHPAGHH